MATGPDAQASAASIPSTPGRRALAAYLAAVATALTVAWPPGMLSTALTRDIAPAVGPYTSAATEALDLGVVVPVALLAAIRMSRGDATGKVLTLVILVLNVCIGVLLLGQGFAQILSGVPLTVGEIVVKMLTFAALTLAAGGLHQDGAQRPFARSAGAGADRAGVSGGQQVRPGQHPMTTAWCRPTVTRRRAHGLAAEVLGPGSDVTADSERRASPRAMLIMGPNTEKLAGPIEEARHESTGGLRVDVRQHRSGRACGR